MMKYHYQRVIQFQGSVLIGKRCNKPMGFLLITALLIVFLNLSAAGAELELVFRHVVAIKDPEAKWPARIDYASWVDDERIVCWSQDDVLCVSTKTGKVEWAVRDVGRLTDWSVSRDTKRLAILSENFTTSVIDCTSGKIIFKADPVRISQILGLRFTVLTRLAFVPNDGRLLVGTYSEFYSRNAYLLDAEYNKPLKSFEMDVSPTEITASPEGNRVAVIADEEVLCVRDLGSNRDVFFRGKRIMEKPNKTVSAIDAPFFSHIRDSGADMLIYTIDNSWATGQVFVHNLKTKQTNSFDARNGHIELDVAFPKRQLVVTGTSTDLTVFDFEGQVIAHKKKATRERNSAVEYSPAGDRILVGCWDNSLSVFSLKENGE